MASSRLSLLASHLKALYALCCKPFKALWNFRFVPSSLHSSFYKLPVKGSDDTAIRSRSTATLLSPSQRKALRAVADTICRSLNDEETKQLVQEFARDSTHAMHVESYCRRAASATDLDVPLAVELEIQKHMLPVKQRELKLLLSLLSSSVGTLILCGFATPFDTLSLQKREVALLNLKMSVLAGKRKAFVALKAVIGLKFLSLVVVPTEHTGSSEASLASNPNWPAVRFVPPPVETSAFVAVAAGRHETVYHMLNGEILGRSTWGATTTPEGRVFDVIIVGSGCGGSVVAAELASAGLRVLVLERDTTVLAAAYLGMRLTPLTRCTNAVGYFRRRIQELAYWRARLSGAALQSTGHAHCAHHLM